jgi:hypothetical protein
MMLRKFSPKLGVVVLCFVLITGLALFPTFQIGVQSQAKQQRLTTPATPATPTKPPTSTATTSYTTPQPPRTPPVTTTTTTEEATPAPPVATTAITTRITPASTDTVNTSPEVNAAAGAADNQTGESGAVNQSAMVMIPLSTMQLLMGQVQDAITAVDNDNKDEAMTALNSVDQELKSAVDASGVSVETTTDG